MKEIVEAVEAVEAVATVVVEAVEARPSLAFFSPELGAGKILTDSGHFFAPEEEEEEEEKALEAELEAGLNSLA